MYQYYNAEPNGEHLEDCVIRAISLALQLPYSQIVKMLNKNGSQNECEEVCLDCYEKMLEDLGFQKELAHNERVKDIANKASVVLIRITGHLTCAIDGVIFDIWDCSDKQADCYWVIDRNKVKMAKMNDYNEELEMWKSRLKAKDRFGINETELINKATTMGVKFENYTELEYLTTYYMLMNDFPSLTNEPYTYLIMAKDWLEAENINVTPSEKLCIYYDKIVRGI